MNSNIKLFYYYNFLTDFGLYYPIATLYFYQITGSFVLAMSIFSIAQFSSAIFEIPTGVFSDRIGRRKTIILSSLFSLFSVLFYAIGFSFLFLAIGAIFEGLSRAFASGNNNALLYDSLTQENKEKEFQNLLGKVSSMFQLSAAISAILGAIIANWSFAWVFWLTLIPLFIRFIISFKFIEPPKTEKISSNIFSHTKEAISLFIQNPKIRNISLASSLNFGIGESVYHFKVAFIQIIWPIWALGIYKTLTNIGATLSFYFSGKFIKKYSELKILIFSNIYSFFANLISLMFPSIFSPITISSTSLFFGLSTISEEGLLQKEFNQAKRATMSSLNSLLSSLIFSIFSPILGFLADKLNPTNALIIACFLSLSSNYFYQKAFKNNLQINK